MKLLPIIAITMGDPASIGPEIAVKALLERKIYSICRPILVGDAKVFQQIIDLLLNSRYHSLLEWPKNFELEKFSEGQFVNRHSFVLADDLTANRRQQLVIVFSWLRHVVLCRHLNRHGWNLKSSYLSYNLLNTGDFRKWWPELVWIQVYAKHWLAYTIDCNLRD